MLYGAGDFINDYEGIDFRQQGHSGYYENCAVAWLPTFRWDGKEWRLASLRARVFARHQLSLVAGVFG